MVLVGCGFIGLSLASIFMVQPILIDLAKDFQVDFSTSRYVFVVTSGLYALSFLLFGPITDYYEHKKVIIVAAMLLATALTLAALSTNMACFMLCMGAVGVFSAIVVATVFPLMGKLSPSGKVGRYMGYCLSATIGGILFGRFAIGTLNDVFGWRYGFISLALVVCTLSMLLLMLKKPQAQASRFKPASLLTSYNNIFLLLGNSRILRLLFSGMLLFVAYVSILTYQTYYLMLEPFSYTARTVGTMSIAGILAVFAAPLSGDSAPKIGVARVVWVGLSIFIVALYMFYIGNNIVFFTLANGLLYLGVYICQPAVFYKINTLCSAGSQGSASALYLFCCLGMGSLSVFLIHPVWSFFSWQGVIATAVICVIVSYISSYSALKNR